MAQAATKTIHQNKWRIESPRCLQLDTTGPSRTKLRGSGRRRSAWLTIGSAWRRLGSLGVGLDLDFSKVLRHQRGAVGIDEGPVGHRHPECREDHDDADGQRGHDTTSKRSLSPVTKASWMPLSRLVVI